MYGERIRQLRKEKGMTLRDLSNELGIPFTTLGNYEREDRQPNFDTFEAIAEYFGVSIDYLSGRRDTRTFDDYVFKSDVDNFEKLLSTSNPEIKTAGVDLFDKFYLITKDGLAEENIRELELIYEVLGFIFRMKCGFNHGGKLRNDFFQASNPYELAMEYIREKQEIEKYLTELFEIYAEKKFK